MYTYVGCQTFAGGFDLGMVQAGFKLVHRAEMKGGFGLANCEANRHLLGYDWKSQATDPAEWANVPADIVVGNPPCSGWSVMSSQKFRGADSPALSCTWAFVDYVARIKPQVAVFESVQQAYSHPDGLTTMRALRERLEARTGQRWDLWHVLHNAYSVGGPAQRRRYFWVASRVPFGVDEPRQRDYPLLNDVIGDLEPLGPTWLCQPYRAPATRYAQQFRSPSGSVDGMAYVDNPLTRRIRDLASAVSWRPGEAIATVCKRHHERFGRLPKSFAATEQRIVERDFKMGFTTPVRWDGEKHARVITGGSLQGVLHPRLNRTITHREAARILGFPDDWRALPLKNTSGLFMTWGKGITVQCGKWIGDWAARALDGCPGELVGKEIGERERVIDVTNTWKKFAI